MRYAGEQPIEVRDPTQVAALPAALIPIAAGIGLIQKGYWANKATGALGTSGGHGTLDDAINRGESGLEREGAIRMHKIPTEASTEGNALGLFQIE